MLFYLRSVFILLLVVSLVLAWQLSGSTKIDTNLADITPTTIQSEGTTGAVAALQKNIEARVLLLLSGDDEDQLDLAEQDLRIRLTDLQGIDLHPSDETLVRELISSLKSYRFAFLNSTHRDQLRSKTNKQIAEESYRRLLSLGGFSVFDFADDPIGWHGEALLDLLPLDIDVGDEGVSQRIVGLSINRGAMDMRTQQEIGKQLDTALAEIDRDFAIKFDRSGVFFFAADAAQAAKSDISLISTVSTVGVIGLLLLVFRSVGALLLPVISVVFGVVFAGLVTHTIYGSLHILTIVFGASLIGIAIDYALHFMLHQSLQSASASNRPLIRALSLSLATSLLGYAALGLAGLAALEKVAVFSCSGLLMAWLTVMCFGSSAITRSQSGSSLLQTLTRAVSKPCSWVKPRVAIVFVFLILAAGATVSIGNQNYTDDPRVFFNPSTELLESERRVAGATSDFEPGRYLIIAGANQSEVYARHQELMTKIATGTAYSAVDFSSIPTWLPSDKQQQENYQLSSRLYGVDGVVTKLVEMIGKQSTLISDIEDDYKASSNRTLLPADLAQLIGTHLPPFWFENSDGSVVSFVLIRKGVNADQLSSITQNIDGVEYINSLQRTSEALSTQRTSAIQLLAIAVVLIALLMMLRYQDWSSARLTIVPLCSIFGFMVFCFLFGITINLFHVMALFLVLGFGMDYVIFVNEMRDNTNIALQAILLSSLTSLLSFGLLSFSSIPVVSSFGLTLLIGNLLNLIGAFVLAHLLTPSYEHQPVS